MVTIGMYYEVFDDKRKIFEQKFQEVLKAMEGLKGHRNSGLYRKVDDPGSYAILSEWDSQDDFTAFITSETFRQVTRWGMEGILKGRPRHKVYPRSDDLTRTS
jgi:heme-degrading monooxygenase HmoA